MKMKIAWFTPFQVQSAIGQFSKAICEYLAKDCDVDIYTPDSINLISTIQKVTRISDKEGVLHLNGKYDHIVYNFGDNYPYHGPILSFYNCFRGIVILHDFVMHHFYTGHYLSNRMKPTEYVDFLRYWYGEKGASFGKLALRKSLGTMWNSQEITDYPLFEPLTLKATGIVCHSAFFRQKIESVALAPVQNIALPNFFNHPTQSANSPANKQQINILTIGNLNPNKQIDLCIQVLANLPKYVRKRYMYKVVGDTQDVRYKQYLVNLIKKHGMNNNIQLIGYQDKNNLSKLLQSADICINLRYPITEGASASLIEEMSMGKPVIVNDIGCYSELPDDVVWKIPLENQDKELSRAIMDLISHEELRIRLGNSAKKSVEMHNTVEKYCTDFLSFIKSLITSKTGLTHIDTVAECLKDIGASRLTKVTSTVAEEIAKYYE